LLLSVQLGYIEFRFEWLRDAWDNYLLFSSVVFFAFAYRFDNRFVLSLALSSLAGWFGIKISRLGFFSSEQLRMSALVYALLVTLVGAFMNRRGIKKHFLQTYLHIATTIALISLLSGLWGNAEFIFLAALLIVSAVSVVLGIRSKRFAFVVYGIGFGYVGVSAEALRSIPSTAETLELLYLITTGSGVIAVVVFLARRFGKEP
jgi:hypothetical protein